MVTNTITVYIDGVNQTRYVVRPLKVGNLLDEQLDECILPLRRIKRNNFAPLTPVEIHIKNTVSMGSTVSETEKVLYFLVANDENVQESPIGSGRYNHDLYLIEVTKYAECIVVDTLTVTNVLGRDYTVGAIPAVPVIS